MLIIQQNELQRLREMLFEFHNSLTESEFRELQHQNRQLWEEYLSFPGYYKKLIQSLIEKFVKITGVDLMVSIILPMN